MDDLEVEGVIVELVNADPDGVRFARTLRRTFDQIYDGRNTGRFRWEDLRKTEKTHFGSLIEINLQREFAFADGLNLDYRIADVDVDCKWSQNEGGWMLPPEAVGEICLLVTGSDEGSVWSVGLIRTVEQLLHPVRNRNVDRTINVAGQAAIQWIWKEALLPQNVLLDIDPAVLKAVMVDLNGPQCGQKRLDELFRRVQNQLIGCGAVATVARQDDYIEMVHANGGSRQNLKPEGIVVFGDHIGHRELAIRLGLPAIGAGDSMSARLIQTEDNFAVQLGGKRYRLCVAGEEPTKPAPDLPTTKRRQCPDLSYT